MMDFGGAIAAVKAGHRVQRDAWGTSAPGRYVVLDGVDSVKLVEDDGSSTTYAAPADDQLAEDWNYVRLPDTGDAEAGDPLAQRTYEGREGPTIPKENIENDNVQFVDTASVGPVPIAPLDEKRPVIDESTAGEEIETIREAKAGQGSVDPRTHHDIGGIAIPRLNPDDAAD